MSRDTVTLVMALVLIKRDAMMNIPVEVFAHEVPILQLQFGDDNVKVESEREVIVDNFDVAEEYERLVRKYDDRAKKDIARKVYGQTPRELAKELDLPYVGGNKATKLAENMVIVDGEDETAEPKATIRTPAKGGKVKEEVSAPKAGGPAARKTKGARA